MVPLVIAYAPFALVIGATAAAHDAALAGWAGSWLIYGGSAHLAALRTLHDTGPVLAIATGLVVNARLVVYSAGLARAWPRQPRWFRIVAAGLIIDPTFAAAREDSTTTSDPGDQRRFFVAAGLTLGAGWSAAVGLGTIVGDRWGGVDLSIIVPLCMVALIGDALRDRSGRAVVAIAGAVALVAGSLPAGSALLVATVVGAVAGWRIERGRT